MVPSCGAISLTATPCIPSPLQLDPIAKADGYNRLTIATSIAMFRSLEQAAQVEVSSQAATKGWMPSVVQPVMFTGTGYARFKGGGVYQGQWRDGVLHGKGMYLWPDGTSFEGTFHTNAIVGAGVFRWPDGSVYRGAVRDGARHGVGRFTHAASGASYEGTWAQGLRHGKGRLTYDREGQSFYEGEFRAGCRHGYGRIVYASAQQPLPGSAASGLAALGGQLAGFPAPAEQGPGLSGAVYVGSWWRDKKQGWGAMRWGSLGHSYVGWWRNDLPNGEGEYVWDPEAATPAAIASPGGLFPAKPAKSSSPSSPSSSPAACAGGAGEAGKENSPLEALTLDEFASKNRYIGPFEK